MFDLQSVNDHCLCFNISINITGVVKVWLTVNCFMLFLMDYKLWADQILKLCGIYK